MKIVAKRDKLNQWDFQVDEFCCDELEEYAKLRAEYGLKSKQRVPDCYLPFHSWGEPNYVAIKFCPFCGEKIQLIIKKRSM